MRRQELKEEEENREFEREEAEWRANRKCAADDRMRRRELDAKERERRLDVEELHMERLRKEDEEKSKVRKGVIDERRSRLNTEESARLQIEREALKAELAEEAEDERKRSEWRRQEKDEKKRRLKAENEDDRAREALENEMGEIIKIKEALKKATSVKEIDRLEKALYTKIVRIK